MGPRDINQELFRESVGDGLIIGNDRAIQRRRRQASRQVQDGEEADQVME
jgi:hypothetical protein